MKMSSESEGIRMKAKFTISKFGTIKGSANSFDLPSLLLDWRLFIRTPLCVGGMIMPYLVLAITSMFMLRAVAARSVRRG